MNVDFFGSRRKLDKKELTRETKIDNLEKFAKTSLVAEVILDRLKSRFKRQPKRNRTSDLSKQQIQTTNSASSSRTQIWLMPI